MFRRVKIGRRGLRLWVKRSRRRRVGSKLSVAVNDVQCQQIKGCRLEFLTSAGKVKEHRSKIRWGNVTCRMINWLSQSKLCFFLNMCPFAKSPWSKISLSSNAILQAGNWARKATTLPKICCYVNIICGAVNKNSSVRLPQSIFFISAADKKDWHWMWKVAHVVINLQRLITQFIVGINELFRSDFPHIDFQLKKSTKL